MADWKSYLEENKDRYLQELLEFLSIPSVSSLKGFASIRMHENR